jgi:hypothetical protein
MGYYSLLLPHGFLKLSSQFLVLIFRGPQLFDLFVIGDQFCDELVDIHEFVFIVFSSAMTALLFHVTRLTTNP